MRDSTKNTVEVESVLQRPEWGGDGEVHINMEVGSDELYVEIRLAGIPLEKKDYGDITVGFEFHSIEAWLNNVKVAEPHDGVGNVVDFIKGFVDGTREYNDLYDDLKEHQYLFHNLEHEIQGKTSIADLEQSLAAKQANPNIAQGQKEKEQSNMSKFDIQARVNPLSDQTKPTKAMASVTIDDVIAINNLTIVEANKSLFVGYPQNRDSEGGYRDIVEFLRDKDDKMLPEAVELKDAIQKKLVEMFKNGERATPVKAEADKKPVDHEIKAYVTPLPNSETSTRGLGTVQVGELFKINSVRVNENTKEGAENFGKLYVAMPARPDKRIEGGYKDVVHPVNAEFGEKLRGAVLKRYENQLSWNEKAAGKDKPDQQREKPATNRNAGERD